MFISQEMLEREKDHIEGFAAEVAWVTHAYATQIEASCISTRVALILVIEAIPLSKRK